MRRLGDIDLAEESLQEAFARASSAWSAEVPERPDAWLYTVARNAGIDRLRRDDALRRRLARDARVLDTAVADAEAGSSAEGDPGIGAALDDDEAGDERIRLLLLCCHPALSRDSQIALTLRLAGGLTTREIAAAFVVDEAVLGQRLSRAKRKIRDAGIPLAMPEQPGERASLLCDILGLIFNEGYLSHAGDGAEATRVVLADAAIELTAIAADALPDEPELGGLLALELFQRSRHDARIGPDGALVPLGEQDRDVWDRSAIRRGFLALGAATSSRRLGPWTLRALIEAEHAIAPSSAATNWARIVRYYDLLLGAAPSDTTRLNRAVAIAEAGDPVGALAAVEGLDSFGGYYLWHAVRADLLLRTGRRADARAAWARASALTSNPAERALLARREREAGS